ncbi:MAG: CHRD domain-containing protein [Candidatus Acidiferrales bacterium]
MKSLYRSLFLVALALLLVPLVNAQTTKFTATLSGSESVPAVNTPAHGTATFELSQNGDSLTYTLSVTDIENVTMVHIHIGPAGKSGPVAVWLYPSKPPAATKEGKFSGELAKGTITAANLAGPLEGKTIADLVTDIKDGNAYVNVHTTAHSGGEIRGQIK